jgi:hypothetical protein
MLPAETAEELFAYRAEQHTRPIKERLSSSWSRHVGRPRSPSSLASCTQPSAAGGSGRPEGDRAWAELTDVCVRPRNENIRRCRRCCAWREPPDLGDPRQLGGFPGSLWWPSMNNVKLHRKGTRGTRGPGGGSPDARDPRLPPGVSASVSTSAGYRGKIGRVAATGERDTRARKLLATSVCWSAGGLCHRAREKEATRSRRFHVSGSSQGGARPLLPIDLSVYRPSDFPRSPGGSEDTTNASRSCPRIWWCV